MTEPMGGAGGASEAEIGGNASSASGAPGAQADGGRDQGGAGADGSEPAGGNDHTGDAGAAGMTAGGARSGSDVRGCLAVGDSFSVDQFSDAADIAFATELGCALGQGDDNRVLTVTRFEVLVPSLAVVWSPHDLFDTYDAYALEGDCADGLQQPTYTSYPGTLARSIEPAIYTLVSCAADAQSVVTPLPAPAANVDCSHALPLPQPETRVLEASRFFSFELDAAVTSLHLGIATVHTNSGAVGKLTRIGPSFEASAELPYLVDTLRFHDIPAGEYCLELAIDPGVSYSVGIDVVVPTDATP